MQQVGVFPRKRSFLQSLFCKHRVLLCVNCEAQFPPALSSYCSNLLSLSALPHLSPPASMSARALLRLTSLDCDKLTH